VTGNRECAEGELSGEDRVSSKASSPERDDEPGPSSRAGSMSKTASGPTQGTVTNTVERALIAQLLEKFPKSEASAKGLANTKEGNLFSVYMRDKEEIFVLPQNLSDFKNDLMMVTICTAAHKRGYTLETSTTKSLAVAVLKTPEAAWFAGYVSQCLLETTGERIDSTSKFAKGQSSFQTRSVGVRYGNAKHLRTDGEAKMIKKLNEMSGFTKDYWGLRGALMALFKSLPANRVTNLETYLQSLPVLKKNIKTSFIWDNRGLFRNEEITYLNQRFHTEVETYNSFITSLSNPTPELARDFDALYERARRGISNVESTLTGTINRRAQLLFVKNAKKRKDIEWNKTKLLDKIAGFETADRILPFMPQSLPGIALVRELPSLVAPVANADLPNHFTCDSPEVFGPDVCASWNEFVRSTVEGQ